MVVGDGGGGLKQRNPKPKSGVKLYAGGTGHGHEPELGSLFEDFGVVYTHVHSEMLGDSKAEKLRAARLEKGIALYLYSSVCFLCFFDRYFY